MSTKRLLKSRQIYGALIAVGVALGFAVTARGQTSSSLESMQPSNAPTETGPITLSNPSISTSTLKLEEMQLKKGRPWSIEMDVEQDSNMVEAGTPGAQTETDYTFAPSYKLNQRLSLSTRILLAEQESEPANTQFADTPISLTLKGWKLNEELSTLHTLTGIVPTNIDSIERDRLQGGVSIGNKLQAETKWGVYSYILGIRRNFHEYELNADFQPNIEWSISNRVQTETPIYGPFSFLSDLTYKKGFTYEGFEHDGFAFSFDINYNVTDAFSANLGMTNEGSALRANGTDSNIEIYDEQTTVLRLGVTYVL